MARGFPEPPVFEYRLDGLEEDWRETSAREVIRYAGIPVGEYRLLVRVRDAFGRAGPDDMVTETTLLTIRVNGPIWQQWWFYAVAFIIVSSGLYALYNYRLEQAMKLQAVRNRIASDLHDEVGSSLSSITIGAQLAARLSPEASEQVRGLLARMGETQQPESVDQVAAATTYRWDTPDVAAFKFLVNFCLPAEVRDSGGVFAEGEAPTPLGPGTGPHVEIVIESNGWTTVDHLVQLITEELPASVTFELWVAGHRLWPTQPRPALVGGV